MAVSSTYAVWIVFGDANSAARRASTVAIVGLVGDDHEPIGHSSRNASARADRARRHRARRPTPQLAVADAAAPRKTQRRQSLRPG